MKSIMQEDDSICFICDERANYQDGPLEEHHVFGGTANRSKSEKHGLKVKLHAFKCHRTGPGAVHNNKIARLTLQAAGQRKFEETHSREEFRKEFGKSVL